MLPLTETMATLEDLARFEGKAELIGGRIIPQMPSGFRHSIISLEIAQSLSRYGKATRRGVGLGDNAGFAVSLLNSGRQSFAPDASFYSGPLPDDDRDFVEGPPTFAVEVRSKGDYGPAAELELAAKRDDYFEAGTLVVWDVDPDAEVIRSYSATDPQRPQVFTRGDQAHAEPAVPGWGMSVDEVFPPG